MDHLSSSTRVRVPVALSQELEDADPDPCLWGHQDLDVDMLERIGAFVDIPEEETAKLFSDLLRLGDAGKLHIVGDLSFASAAG